MTYSNEIWTNNFLMLCLTKTYKLLVEILQCYDLSRDGSTYIIRGYTCIPTFEKK